jgi:branched-chain amino acid:cation transporter, LIVCS family
MNNKKLIISTGFALFSMFFGSGNLVFPLAVGKESGGHFLLASLGIFLTCVVAPLMGAFALYLYKGDSRSFFGTMGKYATFWFPLIALSLMGPFGVLARCLTVAHGSFRVLFPDISLTLFSIATCVCIFLVTLNKNRIVPFLGSMLTPFLLLTLGLIAFFGFWGGNFPQSSMQVTAWNSFTNGFFEGYQTMDLLASFFFSIFIIKHLSESEEKSSSSTFLFSALVGGALLSIVYFCLVYLGTVYSQELEGVPPQQMLAVVTHYSMGPLATPIVCLTVALACFTTAVVLATLFSDFLRQEVAKNRISDKLSMIITLAIAFSVSTLEFAGIAKFLGPILEALYPALIVLTVVNIASKMWDFTWIRVPVALTLFAKLCFF